MVPCRSWIAPLNRDAQVNRDVRAFAFTLSSQLSASARLAVTAFAPAAVAHFRDKPRSLERRQLVAGANLRWQNREFFGAGLGHAAQTRA
jgi:hypothetical protein